MNRVRFSFFAALLIAALLVFSLIALHYRSRVLDEALAEVQEETLSVAEQQVRALETELQKFALAPLVLAEHPAVAKSLSSSDAQTVATLNSLLSSLAAKTGAPYIFLVNSEGTTVAASNFDQRDSFISRSYRFRPYFQEAMTAGSAQYFAKGERTGKAGLFLARRVDIGESAGGVIVVKVEFANLADSWRDPDAITFVVNSDAVILFSSDKTLDYTAIRPISALRRSEILDSQQFGTEPLPRASLTIESDLRGSDSSGQSIQAAVVSIPELGWELYRTVVTTPDIQEADRSVRLQIAIIAMIIAGLVAYGLWRWSLVRQRLRTTEELKLEVARQTSELSNSNRQLEDEMRKRVAMNNRFRKAREELAQANRLGSIGAITASVAHEINQPVAAIRAFSENAVKFLGRRNLEQATENMRSIIELTQRIGSITTELRRYARRGSRAISRVKISDLFEGIDLLIGDKILEDNVQFGITGADPSLFTVKADRVRLEQVLVNIIQNSLDALADIEQPEIRVRIDEIDDNVSITISDNGPGIHSEIEHEIFDPFFTNKHDGLGIGLGIAKDIVREYGGNIGVVPPDPELGGASIQVMMKKQ